MTKSSPKVKSKAKPPAKGKSSAAPLTAQKTKARGPESQFWCFTGSLKNCPNPTELFDPLANNIGYVVAALEFGMSSNKLSANTERIGAKTNALGRLPTAQELGEMQLNQPYWHWQGYIEFKNGRKRLSAVKKVLPGYHLEPRRGTQQQAIDYCKKGCIVNASEAEVPADLAADWPTDCKYYQPTDKNVKDEQPSNDEDVFKQIKEYGTPGVSNGAGSRTDLDAFVKAVRSGLSENDAYTQYPGIMARYRHMYKSIREAKNYTAVPLQSNERPWLCVFIGPAGAGKTRLAKHVLGLAAGGGPVGELLYHNSFYQGDVECPNVVIDEFHFDNDQMPLGEFQRLFQEGSNVMNTKGSEVRCCVKRAIITTEHTSIHAWYPRMGMDEEVNESVMRRIDKIVLFMSSEAAAVTVATWPDSVKPKALVVTPEAYTAWFEGHPEAIMAAPNYGPAQPIVM